MEAKHNKMKLIGIIVYIYICMYVFVDRNIWKPDKVPF